MPRLRAYSVAPLKRPQPGGVRQFLSQEPIGSSSFPIVDFKLRVVERLLDPHGADSGFCREEIMAWRETQHPVVYYSLGLARNTRSRELIELTRSVVERFRSVVFPEAAHVGLAGH
jgi:hypothetical protein